MFQLADFLLANHIEILGTALVVGFMGVGAWLESINGIDGTVDEFFTPFPMGCLALLIAWGIV